MEIKKFKYMVDIQLGYIQVGFMQWTTEINEWHPVQAEVNGQNLLLRFQTGESPQ